jgi:drug/metabolite transporter (DMT)-like permease
MSNRTLGAIYGILAASIWGGMYVVSDVVLERIPPFTLLTMRLLLGLLVLGVLLYRQKPSLPEWKTLREILAVGVVGFGISVGAQFVGTDLSTAVNGALITSASPAFILLFAVMILSEKLTRVHLLAIGLATLGVVIIIDPAQADFSSDTFLGNIALAVAAITWGLYSVLVRRVSARTETLIVTFFAFIGGLALTLPAAALELSSEKIGEINGWVILGILYLGVISTAGAMWFWNRAFALVEAGTASLFFFAQPLVGAGLGILLLDQDLTWNLLIGAGLIVAGVLITTRQSSTS